MSTEGNGAAEGDKHHNESEWESQRQTFTYYYQTENKTLKEAAKCMAETHNFYATPRQWERKIKAWGLSKYVSRQQRLDQLAAEGRDLSEVAQPGRRPRKFSDSKLLHIKDDRNVRRFAKRELSRSPSRNGSRSRSVSLSPCPSPSLKTFSDEIVLDERTYDIDPSALTENHDQVALPAVRTFHNSENLQAHVLHSQELSTGVQHTDLFLSMPIQPQDPLSTTQYDQFPHMAEEMPLHPSMDEGIDPLNAGTAAMTTEFYSQHQEGLDLSPSHTRSSNHTTWSDTNNMNTNTLQASFDSGLDHTVNHIGPSHAYDYAQDSDPSMPTIVIAPHDVDDIDVPVQSHPMSFDFSFIPDEAKEDTSSYQDLSGCLERYTQNVQAALASAAVPPSVRNDLSQQVEFQRRIFVHEMNTIMSNFMASQQRAIQSIQQKNQALQNHITAMFQEKSQSVVHEPVSAHAALGHHRFSLSGPVPHEYHHLYQTPSRPITPIGVSM